jgi:hypothetical protein
MGIGSDFIEVLTKMRMEGLVRRKASVIDIGAQQLESSFFDVPEHLRWLGLLFGIDEPPRLNGVDSGSLMHGNLRHLGSDAPPARDFWHWLGFRYTALDIDGTPGTLPLDLNYDSVPPEAAGKYRLVTNFGTTEHVVNQLNAFKIIHDLTAPRGLMIHQVPAQGMFNHGLVNYNFKFFWMLALSNGYKFAYAAYNQGESYDMPENIVNWIASIGGAMSGAPSYFGTDGTLTVVLQKPLALPFVAPLDLPTDAQPDIAALKRRYWAVFDQDNVGQLVEEETAKTRPLATIPLRRWALEKRVAKARERVRTDPKELVRDWEYAALTPRVFRETLLSCGAVMIRSAADVRTLQRIADLLNNLFDAHVNLPPEEFAKHMASSDYDEQEFWREIQRGHIFDKALKAAGRISYFDILRDSGLWDLAARAFPEAEVVESQVANCRRVTDGELNRLWDQPIPFHIDAQFFYTHRLSINFWTPLVACGIDAPGLKVVPLGVAQTRKYLEYNPVGYELDQADLAHMHKFKTEKMELPALEANALLARAWAPHFRPGDVLAFTNFTMHATHCTSAMTKPRMSVEARVDLPGYRFG